eukprot:TRINITY_DN34984_c0_g1_i1.p1 TRINITY_DN34984_c0_g1~~TRINITY_DN34984_c0_g1_i1.p1  ORF type:complete len:138 (+),score=13.32 TRINITY_DN34984_c0_g1_i1:98-511(+)
MSRSSVPLDALCNCLEYLSLQERLLCERLSRRWREAVQDPYLWVALAPEPEELSCLNWLITRFGSHIRELHVRSQAQHRLGASLLKHLAASCPQLRELRMGGFRSRELDSFCKHELQMTSLRALSVDCDPYFTLGSF